MGWFSAVRLQVHINCSSQPFLTFTLKIINKVKKLSHQIRLTTEFKSDLRWWDLFITSQNGISFLYHSQETSLDYRIRTDASGTWGCGAGFGDQRFQFPLGSQLP